MIIKIAGSGIIHVNNGQFLLLLDFEWSLGEI